MFVLSAMCLLGIVSVFLFPISAGPFTASHGPATTFKAIQSMNLILLSIASVRIYLDLGSISPIQIGRASNIPPNSSAMLHPSLISPLLC